MNLLCEDIERAGQNRQRVAQGFGNRYYDRQQNILEGWEYGAPPPFNLAEEAVYKFPFILQRNMSLKGYIGWEDNFCRWYSNKGNLDD